MREIVVTWFGRRRKDWDRLSQDYEERIAKVTPFRDVLLKPAQGGDGARIVQEGRQLLESLPDRSYLVALDRRAKPLPTLQFAKRLSDLRQDWPHAVVFALGSDLGLSRDVLDAAKWRLSLGAMTLPHELARLVLLEQIYRALAIERGIKYHRVPLDGH